MGKTADPAEGLEPDITTIEDVAEREAKQLEYYGGDPIDDDEDLTSADRGDNILPDELLEDRGDEITETKEEAAEEDTEATDDEADADAEGGDDDTDEADSESADEDDVDDSEGDDGDDEEEADDVVEPESAPKSDQRVPLSRFNEINERRKEAERELQDLKSKSTAVEEAAVSKFDFDAAENEYMDLLLDGKTKEAGAKRAEIRAAEQEIFKQEAKRETITDVNEQRELSALNDLSLEAESMYPVFNEGHQDYDPRAAGKVVTYMKGYMADGLTVSDAFVAGLADVIDQFGLDNTSDEVEETTPAKKAATKKAPIKKTKEKLEVAKKQATPAALAGQGSSEAGSVVPNIENMTDEEYDALPESTKAKMRGDTL